MSTVDIGNSAIFETMWALTWETCEEFFHEKNPGVPYFSLNPGCLNTDPDFMLSYNPLYNPTNQVFFIAQVVKPSNWRDPYRGLP